MVAVQNMHKYMAVVFKHLNKFTYHKEGGVGVDKSSANAQILYLLPMEKKNPQKGKASSVFVCAVYSSPLSFARLQQWPSSGNMPIVY